MSEANHHPASILNTTTLAYGAAALGSAIILAPHLLPAIGIGEQALTDTFYIMHGDVVTNNLTYLEAGTGLAGYINQSMAQVPVVGETLAQGGWITALSSAVIGLGGITLAHHVEKEEEGTGYITGKLLKYAAISTSVLISLPTLLTGLSMGINFINYLFDCGSFQSNTAMFLDNTIGQSGSPVDNHYLGLSGLAAAIPHALTCGAALMPAVFGVSSVRKKDRSTKTTENDVCVHISLDTPTAAGRPAHAKLTLTHADSGAPLTADELAVVHTEKLHLFVVDQRLQDYHHIHPKPTGKPGEFAFSFTPGSNNRYSAWADFEELTGEHHQIKATLPAKRALNLPATPRPNNRIEMDGASFSWQAPQTLTAGKPVEVTIDARDFLGNPLTGFEPIMGAYAHLVGFGADGNSFIHCHPTSHDGKLTFHIEAEQPGPAQFFLQIKRNGRESFIPFGQLVLPGPGCKTCAPCARGIS